MLKTGGSFALRLLNQQYGNSGSKLLSTAVMGSRAAAAEVAAEGQAISAGSLEAVAGAQFSTSAAAAMAQKKAHIVGSAGMSLASSTRSFGSFASSKVAASSTAVGAAAAEQKPSMLSRLAKAAAVVAGAVTMAMCSASADAPHNWQWFFQDMATSTGQAMADLHHDIMFFLITIIVVVYYMLYNIVTKFHYSRQLKPEKLTHHTTLEVIWTVIPTLVVLSIAVPSLTLIYSLDQHTDRPGLTVKVIGRQWYWSYEMHDHLQQKLLDPDRLVSIAEKAVKA
mmetsp:Transcript_27960/g.71300  ORF Transcript_27960/g.71300 Transcript_27960/m.71300 type:complete len:281 (-) Transcript_27960:228-1070(-)|eukprot:CAMPEP_0202857134 /NCGR_PEP_ID=MMETSP1391-20130828/182_1 /ASSEMBLY_ACC=CAM_ASM_000867 /TAXON_ID=1034604 /ORGANISM="Chlamydomonas leiostraca, Strain SAG 11-49" /LENGTH=280 /DNA_ID=CAMNT_0049535893 /DNA_START=89 /DNA_END=931 /DNA_ORIENTATION=+